MVSARRKRKFGAMAGSPYHTLVKPVDVNGKAIKPLDLVVLGDIPEHNWSDKEFRSLKEYAGCYGLVTYHSFGDRVYEPYYNRNNDHPGWVSGDGKTVFVESRKIDAEKNTVISWGFWMPASSLTLIPYNCLIMNIFVEYPWQMQEADGPEDYLFIREGIPEFDYLKRLIVTPYQKLVEAHNAAMSILK